MTGRVMLARDGELSGAEAVAAATTGACSVSDLVAAALDRIQECDEAVGAFRIVGAQAAVQRAKDLDGHPAGPLYGLVVGVKDVIDTADLPTGYGSPLYADHQPAADADVVHSLRRAGALVLGKTESTEFAMYQPTRTRNPADLDRTPGGSSSGSAAAVAAGMVPVALGTQTAGSVVRPAAYCGVYGFKPSRGWTSTKGVWQLARHLDTLGIFTRSAADLMLTYRALRAAADRSLATRPRPARRTVAVLSGSEWGAADSDVSDALRGVADLLAGAGWDVQEMAMPACWARLPGHHDTVMAVEVARNLHQALGPRVHDISESAQAIVERGDRCTARDYLDALAAAQPAAAVMEPLASVADLLIAPSALGVAPEGLGYTGDPVMCRPWTLLGLPAANVPAWHRSDGLPVGVQAVASGFDDMGFLSDLVSIEAAISERK
jgi:Asp-tRNA(Asn)/Glu-tRNA(Gln) amidotransferase A subunit family amidase